MHEQIVDVSALHPALKERISEHMHKQIVDVPVLQKMKDRVELVSRDSAACGDDTTDPSDSRCAEDRERPDCAVHRQSCGSACDHAEATVVDLTVPQVAVSSSERIVAQIVDLPASQVVHSAPKKRKKNRKKPVVEPQQDAEVVSQRSRDLADLAHDPQWRALMSSIVEVSGWEPDAKVEDPTFEC